jgi:hypothetical protein
MKDHFGYVRSMKSLVTILVLTGISLVLNRLICPDSYTIFGWLMLTGLGSMQVVFWVSDSKREIVVRLKKMNLINKGTMTACVCALMPVGSVGIGHYIFGNSWQMCVLWLVISLLAAFCVIFHCFNKWEVPRLWK